MSLESNNSFKRFEVLLNERARSSDQEGCSRYYVANSPGGTLYFLVFQNPFDGKHTKGRRELTNLTRHILDTRKEIFGSTVPNMHIRYRSP